MKSKLALKLLILAFSALFFVFLANVAKAAEGVCANQPCFVPAPTVITPAQNSTTTNDNLVISGLTWKTTKVEIYIDGVKQNNVTLIKHEDYYASFSVKPEQILKPGKHVIYAYAIDEKNGWGGVSKESLHTRFTITIAKSVNVAKVIKQEVVKKEPVLEKNNKTATSTSSSTTSVINNDDKDLVNEKPAPKPALVPAVKTVKESGDVFAVVEQNKQPVVDVSDSRSAGSVSVTTTVNQQLGGGAQEEFNNAEANEINLQPAASKEEVLDELSGKEKLEINDYQRRLKTNRIVGFVILAGIALVSLFWLLLKEPVFKEELKDDDKV